ncbi:VOC family protein [Desertimonas flava]|uniref:VOC family protein n=1 Tax=Desertimonas flava TaxID=2064846 RepID=UPI000E34F6FD|nr:VOC family protein [Desertimonas flava]
MSNDHAASRLVALAVDANDPPRLARFWAAALGWELGDESGEPGSGDHVITVVPTDGTRFHLDIAFAPGPKRGRNRLHLDLTTTSTDDQNESVASLLSLGARHIDIGQRADERHVVLADPEGNEFCILAPGNQFLAGTGRLGSITCEGLPDVGYFWSAALGWPLVWDQDDETAIRAPDGRGPLITWGGPPVPPKHGKNRLHLDIAPPVHVDQAAEVDRLLALGATPADIGQGDVAWVVLADPGDNEFCVLTPRD